MHPGQNFYNFNPDEAGSSQSMYEYNYINYQNTNPDYPDANQNTDHFRTSQGFSVASTKLNFQNFEDEKWDITDKILPKVRFIITTFHYIYELLIFSLIISEP